MAKDDSQNQGRPQPHSSLSSLDPFIGTWSIVGHTVGSDKDNIARLGKMIHLEKRDVHAAPEGTHLTYRVTPHSDQRQRKETSL